MVKVIVRDGRLGTDPSRLPAGRGAVLMTFDSDSPAVIGQKLRLDDGTHVVIIGIHERYDNDGLIQTATVAHD